MEKDKDKISTIELQEAIEDACASLLAYSICMESWRLALQKKREKTKMWTFYIVVLLFLFAAFTAFQSCTANISNITDTSKTVVTSKTADTSKTAGTSKTVDTSNAAVTSKTSGTSNAADTSNAVDTTNAAVTSNTANKLSCPNGFIIALIGIGVAIIIYYYFSEFKNQNKWLEYNIEMLNHLSENRTSLIVCDSKTKDRMTSLINQYRCDKWVEKKKKQEQNQNQK